MIERIVKWLKRLLLFWVLALLIAPQFYPVEAYCDFKVEYNLDTGKFKGSGTGEPGKYFVPRIFLAPLIHKTLFDQILQADQNGKLPNVNFTLPKEWQEEILQLPSHDGLIFQLLQHPQGALGVVECQSPLKITRKADQPGDKTDPGEGGAAPGKNGGGHGENQSWNNPDPVSIGETDIECEDGTVYGDCYIGYQMKATASHAINMMVGNPADEEDSGATGAVTNLIAGLYEHQPASGGEWLAYIRDKINPASPVYAQGIGYAGLTSLLPIWSKARDLAFFMMAIIFVFMGLAIMLRVQLNPNTVMTIQSALPKLIISLVLIWFSFAISGFLIDVMYLLIYLLIWLMKGILPDATLAMIRDNFQNTNVILMTWRSFGAGAVTTPAKAVSSIIVDIMGLSGIAKIPVLGWILKGAFSVIASLIIAIALLFALFKIFFVLLKAYIYIILGIILSPLSIMIGALPGVPGIQLWLKNLVGHLLTFVITIGMILLGAAIIGNAASTGEGFVPPLIGKADPGALPALIGLGIILTIPHAAEMASEVVKAPGIKFGPTQALGAGLGGAGSIGRGATGYAWNKTMGGVIAKEKAWQEASSKAALAGAPVGPPANLRPQGARAKLARAIGKIS